MLTITMLPAGHGDCLVVEYGPSQDDLRRVLIDAGTIHTWRDHVRPRLLGLPNETFELFVITHVDEDHIGGAVELMKDAELNQRVRDVWFNGFVHCEEGGNVLGPVDGERLTKLIVDGGGFRWNKKFKPEIDANVGGAAVVPSDGALKSITLPGGAKLTLLSPSGPKLKRMADEWTKVVLAAGLVEGAGTDRPAGNVPTHHKAVKEIPAKLSPAQLQQFAKPTAADTSKANGSSIAFVFEYEGKRALLGADAHADTLVANLPRFAKKVKEQGRVRFDLVKLAHHGSRANVTTQLIEMIDAENYLISTNGANFGHPDDAAICRIIASSARKPKFWCNYRSDRTEPWVDRAKSCGAVFKLPPQGKEGMRVTA